MSDLLADRIARVRAEWKKAFDELPGRPKKPWTGKTKKSVPPPDVKLRILRTWSYTCHITGLKITTETPDFDHVIPLEDEGPNAEFNFRPALPKGHRVKTAAENKARDRADRKAKAAAGIKTAPKRKIKTAPAAVRPPQEAASKVEKGSKLDGLRALGPGNLSRRLGHG